MPQEVFFQLNGKMHVDIVEKDQKKRIEIAEVREWRWFLLAHS